MKNASDPLFQLDGRPNLLKAIPFGLQHVLAMFVANVTPIIILANAVKLPDGLPAALVQNAMLIAGLGTLVQLYPIWRIGSRTPMVMGISFTFLSLAIGIASQFGMGTLIGAVIVGGLVEGLLGLCARLWLRLISPIVAATVVTGIGFSLLPIGANSFAGGFGSPDFGSVNNWIVGTVTLVACLAFQILARGTVRSLAVLFSLIVGYALAACMGMVNLDALSNTSLVALPKCLPFRPEFKLGPILSLIAIFLVSATETIGDISALASAAFNRKVSKRELSGAVACDGFVSAISGLFGCTPITSFSQNVGLIAMTGVVNRLAIATGAAIMLLAGVFPAVGVILTSIPQPVLGGCSIMMFGSIIFAGLGMLAKCGFSQRNMVIVSITLSVGLGFTQVSAIFNIFPEIVRTIFADNCVATVFILALLLDNTIPKDKDKDTDKAPAPNQD